ncbi:MAG TPA: hypothetical protein VHD84_03560 [Candidatus Saccharimonadales bacterium]|nr:hypothetical protein [Candidatus Saccharimonadales bacterium]
MTQTYEIPTKEQPLETANKAILRAEKSSSLTPEALAILRSLADKATTEGAENTANIIHQVTHSAGTAGVRFH